jgi:hypothetical protein
MFFHNGNVVISKEALIFDYNMKIIAEKFGGNVI